MTFVMNFVMKIASLMRRDQVLQGTGFKIIWVAGYRFLESGLKNVISVPKTKVIPLSNKSVLGIEYRTFIRTMGSNNRF